MARSPQNGYAPVLAVAGKTRYVKLKLDPLKCQPPPLHFRRSFVEVTA